jgi:hypothetical protein
MNKGVPDILLIMFMPVLVSAEVSDLDLLGFEAELHGAVEVAYQSQYLWHGFEVFSEDGALQISTDLDLFDTGFGVSVIGHRANTSGHEDGERWDLGAYYQDSVFRGEAYATHYRAGWFYYMYPQLSRKQMALHEFYGHIDWPRITGIQGLVPGYSLIMLTPSYSDSPGVGSNARGFLHIGTLDYTFSVPGFFLSTPEQVFRSHWEIVFNDGVSPLNGNVDHGWSHIQAGISTDIDVGFGIALTPSVDYKMSEENSVNQNEGFLVAIGARYDF